MRVVFMGTPDIAATCLKQILDDGFEVVGVYTQPDRPKGRGMKLVASPVKEVALAQGIPVEDVSLLVRRNMHAERKHLSPIKAAIGILEIDSSLPDTLDLGAKKGDSRLVFFIYKIVVPSLFVLGNDLNTFFFLISHNYP